jgi:hypothetical protein
VKILAWKDGETIPGSMTDTTETTETTATREVAEAGEMTEGEMTGIMED